jgi:hypothetical protein
MEDKLFISTAGDENLKSELFESIRESGLEVDMGAERVRGMVPPMDIIVALSSAGTLTVLYQIFAKIIERNKNREITIELNGKRFTLKGHSLRDEKDFLNMLLPLLTGRKERKSK